MSVGVVSVDGFREHLRRTESPRTVLAYLSDAARFEAFRAGRPAIDALEAWADALARAGLRPQTVARRLAGAKRWLAYRARHGDAEAMAALAIVKNGYTVARGPRQADMRQVAPMGYDEYRRAMAAAPEWGRRLLGFLWWTGARVGEALGDRMAGIPHLTVRHGRELLERGWTETLQKGSKRRVIVLPSPGRKELAAWLDGRNPDGPLFPSPVHPGSAASPQAVNAMLHRAGVSGGAHRLRHAYRSRLRQAGVSAEIAARLMGHGPASVTLTYGQADAEELVREAERLSGPDEPGGAAAPYSPSLNAAFPG